MITWPIAIWPPTGKKRANDIVRTHHALTVSRVNRRKFALADALRAALNFAVGGWEWVYNSASTIHHPLTAFDGTGVVGHQSLARDHLAYCDLATDR